MFCHSFAITFKSPKKKSMCTICTISMYVFDKVCFYNVIRKVHVENITYCIASKKYEMKKGNLR